MGKLSKEEILRYSRHLIIPEVGVRGQERLKDANVLCVGAGGLGSPLATYLTAAGVGRIGILDFDVVDKSNLQRQILHYTRDVGKLKVESASEKLREINPEVEIEGLNVALNSSNALNICGSYDIIADGTDNFPTRYLVNDACVMLGKPNVYASVYRFEGRVAVFDAEKGPCYRCVFSEPPPPGFVPNCAEGGVLGVLPGIMGTIQATEVIKLIIGGGDPLIGRMLLFDALDMTFEEIKLERNPNCPICGETPTIHELIDYEAFCGIPKGGHLHEVELKDDWVITPRELKVRIDSGKPLKLIDVREPSEWEICHLPNAQLIPMNQISHILGEFNPSDEIVLYCRTGIRSAKVTDQMIKEGFHNVKNLIGGIHGWADDVDQKLPKY